MMYRLHFLPLTGTISSYALFAGSDEVHLISDRRSLVRYEHSGTTLMLSLDSSKVNGSRLLCHQSRALVAAPINLTRNRTATY